MKYRYIVVALILFVFIAGSSASARVLPVNEDLESQEVFIQDNIDMPDLPGTSEYIVQEDDVLSFKCLSGSSIKINYEFYTFSNVLLALNPEFSLHKTYVER